LLGSPPALHRGMPGVETPFALKLSSGTDRNSAESITTHRWWSKVWRNHAYILPSFLISLVVCAWFVTWGDWNFFEPEQFCGFYDAQALSMIDGRLNVPPTAIASEAFVFEGKTYGYFGIAPALLRLPLIVAFDGMDGLWSRLMMMIACAINLICAYRILRLIRRDAVTTRNQRVLHSLFILCAGIGSTNVFLIGRSFTYHEAIMWGGTFGLLFAWTLLKYFAKPSLGLLALASLFAFMSFHSRATVGTGTLLAMCSLIGILIWRAIANPQAAHSWLAFGVTAKPFQHALIAAIAVSVTVATYFGVNYAKFRTLNGVPLQYYNFYKQIPVRMQITSGRQIHIENIPTTLATYFGLHGVSFDRNFPWVFPSRDPMIVGSPAIDVVEGFSTYPTSMPALTLLAVAGCALLVRGSGDMIRRVRLPAITLLAGGGIILATVGITERYLHDLYPALIVCAAVGVTRLESERRAAGKTAVIAVLSLISVALNCSFSLIHQRTTTGSPLAKQIEFKQLQQSIDRLLHGQSRG
jgi:hypothetical protein